MTMRNLITKAAAIGAAVLTMAAFAAPAQAGSRWVGPAVGGLVVGTMIGAAAASSAYAGPMVRCRYVDQYDRFGFYVGTAKVCRSWY
jgi:hypothetical protein